MILELIFCLLFKFFVIIGYLLEIFNDLCVVLKFIKLSEIKIIIDFYVYLYI